LKYEVPSDNLHLRQLFHLLKLLQERLSWITRFQL
jgi:hypothetical protein